MNRSMILALPLAIFAVACAPASSDEEATSASEDLTGVSDLATLESTLGLVKDPNRTRPEATVKAGPCYRKLEAGDRRWNMRRYTRGAAFFYTNDAGAALDPVVCVDLDVNVPTFPEATLALSGLSLDLALRFPLGGYKGAYQAIDYDHAGLEVMTFGKAELVFAIVPSNIEHTFGDNIPSWDGRAVVRQVKSGFGPPNRDVTRLLPHVANLAYRFAKDDGSTSMASDPVGRFTSVEDRSAGDALEYVFHFERADITYQSHWSSTEGGSDYLNLVLRQPAIGYAGCYRSLDGQGHDFICHNRINGKPWEEVLGHD